MWTKREMDIDARLRYYEAFIAVRDVIRLVEAACNDYSERVDITPRERATAHIERLKWNCVLSVLEVKRASYDENSDAVSMPCEMELRAIEVLADESYDTDFDGLSLEDIRHIGAESLHFFSRVHP